MMAWHSGNRASRGMGLHTTVATGMDLPPARTSSCPTCSALSACHRLLVAALLLFHHPPSWVPPVGHRVQEAQLLPACREGGEGWAMPGQEELSVGQCRAGCHCKRAKPHKTHRQAAQAAATWQ